MLRSEPVGIAERNRRRCRYCGTAPHQDVRQGEALVLEAELERLAARVGGIRSFIGVEAEIEQQHQHLGTIDAYCVRHEPAHIADWVGQPPLGMASAEPLA